MTKMGESLLQMKRHRIMHAAADLIGFDAPASVFCPVGLGAVFDDGNVVFAGNLEQRVKVCRMAIKMDGQDRACAGRDGAFNQLRVQIQSAIVDINKDGPSADVTNGPTRCDKGERRSNDFVSRTKVKQLHRDMKRRSAVVEANAVFPVTETSEAFFEFRDLRTETEGAII